MEPLTRDTRGLNFWFFAAQIEISIPNKYSVIREEKTIWYLDQFSQFKVDDFFLSFITTGGLLLTLFFKTVEKQPCKQKTM